MLSEEKKTKKLINTNVIKRYNATAVYCDELVEIQFQLIQTHLHFFQ